MNKILFLTLAIAIAAVAGVEGLTVTQEAEAHCDGVGNCNGIQRSGSGGSGNDGGGVMVVMTSLLLIPIFVLIVRCCVYINLIVRYGWLFLFPNLMSSTTLREVGHYRIATHMKPNF